MCLNGADCLLVVAAVGGRGTGKASTTDCWAMGPFLLLTLIPIDEWNSQTNKQWQSVAFVTNGGRMGWLRVCDIHLGTCGFLQYVPYIQRGWPLFKIWHDCWFAYVKRLPV